MAVLKYNYNVSRENAISTCTLLGCGSSVDVGSTVSRKKINRCGFFFILPPKPDTPAKYQRACEHRFSYLKISNTRDLSSCYNLRFVLYARTVPKQAARQAIKLYSEKATFLFVPDLLAATRLRRMCHFFVLLTIEASKYLKNECLCGSLYHSLA